MAIHLTEDVKTLEELRESAEAILEQLQHTHRPIVVTRNGKPAAVMLEPAVYERLIHTLNLGRLLAEAEEAARAGQTRPAEELFDELASEASRAEDLPRGNRPRRRA